MIFSLISDGFFPDVSRSMEEKDSLKTMMQGVVLFRDQLQRIRAEESELHSYLQNKATGVSKGIHCP